MSEYAGAIRTGDPLDAETQMGSLISTAHRERVHGFVERGAAEGAEVVVFDPAPFAAAGIEVATLNLLSGGAQAGHDSARLARWLYAFCKQVRASAGA